VAGTGRTPIRQSEDKKKGKPSTTKKRRIRISLNDASPEMSAKGNRYQAQSGREAEEVYLVYLGEESRRGLGGGRTGATAQGKEESNWGEMGGVRPGEKVHGGKVVKEKPP